ncbi:methanethiol S-methyltransferase [Dyella mobilis]|uniref:methanethiol S-methyltransferase n=1 Tax=Dyella mobilis TaxID=1849582 RepID=A0ABS2KAI7_9GAMM|nr:methanethiol S-methyltransferase [Dyella mobilis]MBM7128212.1 isoprenylcysteine carboxylmethyltransferase family protein [Dyella mobilis]GLR00030.1 membrane protein [Dyella mobilis]
MGFAALAYGAFVYLFFLATFLYTIAFVERIPGIKTIDGGPNGSVWTAVVVDLLLLGIFAIQHSVMARRGFKQWWTRYIPLSIERSTYVLFASLAIALLLWQWRPLTGVVWDVRDSAAGAILIAFSAIGWIVLLISTCLINHFELFGLQQVFHRWRESSAAKPTFKTPAFYKYVRHPIYLGFILAFWSTPYMTHGHLLFAAAATGYIFVGIFFEERDLITLFGEKYRNYRQRVPMIIPLLPKHVKQPPASAPRSQS